VPVCEVWEAMDLRIISWECGTKSFVVVRKILKLK
jgi:hypothetical protein